MPEGPVRRVLVGLYTFPLDALTIATLEYHERVGADGMAPICWAALGLITLIVLTVLGRTLAALATEHLLIAEKA